MKLDYKLCSGGTGTSPNGMIYRNKKGLCGMQNCGKLLGENRGYWMFGEICTDCDKKIKDTISKL